MTRTDTGTFIVFEGIDGAGKTRLIEFLAGHLRAAGVQVVTSREPTYGPWGKKLRESAVTGRMSAAEEIRYLTEDRREHVRDLILPALHRGETVLLDRYFYSTIAYQGSRGEDASAIAATMAAEFPIPDRVFLIDVPPEVGLARIARGRGEVPNQFEQQESLAAARAAYLKMAAQYPNFVKMDGTQPVEVGKEESSQTVEESENKKACTQTHRNFVRWRMDRGKTESGEISRCIHDNNEIRPIHPLLCRCVRRERLLGI